MALAAFLGRRVVSGLAGAVATTVVNEVAKKFVPRAPRLDVLGERAVAAPLHWMGKDVPKSQLYAPSMAMDLLANGAYFALGLGRRPRHPIQKATVLGLLAGLGAVYLAPAMGLGDKPTARSPQTKVMTVMWYTLGALVAAAVGEAMMPRREQARRSLSRVSDWL